jgi:hypothetical protein
MQSALSRPQTFTQTTGEVRCLSLDRGRMHGMVVTESHPGRLSAAASILSSA